MSHLAMDRLTEYFPKYPMDRGTSLGKLTEKYHFDLPDIQDVKLDDSGTVILGIRVRNLGWVHPAYVKLNTIIAKFDAWLKEKYPDLREKNIKYPEAWTRRK